jgi:hypothetical protein
MAELKTKQNTGSVENFLDTVEDEVKRKDCKVLLDIMKEVTKEEPKMWGDSIIGFGTYHYKSKSGQEGDWFITGFSPRKGNISIYLMHGHEGYEELFDKLGKHKMGKGCLYLKSLNDINMKILKDIIKRSVRDIQKRYPADQQ